VDDRVKHAHCGIAIAGTHGCGESQWAPDRNAFRVDVKATLGVPELEQSIQAGELQICGCGRSYRFVVGELTYDDLRA
jgi:hypothetical protein